MHCVPGQITNNSYLDILSDLLPLFLSLLSHFVSISWRSFLHHIPHQTFLLQKSSRTAEKHVNFKY